MSVNKHKPHWLILPEDDANRQIATGFELSVPNIQVLRVANGWGNVRDSFKREHNRQMQKYPERLMVLLVDFDNQADRRADVTSEVLDSFRDRVFVLGSYVHPEKLKSALGMSYEKIGKVLARECVEGTGETWGHPLLRHNRRDLLRIRKRNPFR
ncbi:hypothetical protein [Polyangium fumosum]|uniref:Uncharacterized protein n=1 Tax=Polyangium fumosum TaxID=889272 RepID=A0A4V5PN60_9BACT|nr:hypothetical protein [Polyangium fumosum]TKD09531.1 hypothetical protein E8A74_12470 [Polyangium fumosum]